MKIGRVEIVREKLGCGPVYLGFDLKDWSFTVHLLPFRDIQWGYREEWDDGPLCSFGLGPLILVCWCLK